MKLFILFVFSSSVSWMTINGEPLYQTFDKAGFYSAMASGKPDRINSELSILEASSIKEKEAYEGALLMRKAGSIFLPPREKLESFRSGYRKLEASLAKDSSNAEYHFLRLMIQEHVPKIVRYDRDRETDSQDVYRSFRSLPPAVQKAILQYCKHSKFLNAKELNE